MPYVRPHHHPCALCHAKTECPGAWEENYDGIPDVICREYHQEGGPNPDFTCEACEAKRSAICHYCGERPKREGSDYCGPECAIDAEG